MNAIQYIFMRLPLIAVAAVILALILRAAGIKQQRIKQFLYGATLVALALHAVIFLRTTLAYVNFPFEQKSVVEGVTLYNAVEYTHGRQPYRDPTLAPFRSMVYPPVHEIALAGVVAIFGGPTLAGARLFSLLSALGAACIAALAVHRRTRSPFLATLGGGLLICAYGLTQQWLEQVRNDALLVFLTLLGLYLAERAIEKNRLPIASLVALLLALYTKQSAIFAAAAVVVALFLRNRRRALLWATLYTVSALLVFILMQFWSDGWFAFYVLKVPANVGARIGQAAFGFHFGLLTLVAFAAALHFSLKQIRSAQPSIWALAFLFALPLCFLQSIKWGGAMNAFLPLLPLLGILASFALHDLLAAETPRPGLQLAALTAALLQVAFLAYQPLLPSRGHLDSQHRIRMWVRAATGDVLVSGFSSHTYMNGKKFFGDPVIMGDLEQAHLWKGNAVIEKVRRGGFDLLILRPKIEPRDLRAAVAEKYVLAEKIHFPLEPPIGGWPYMQAFVPQSAPWRPTDALSDKDTRREQAWQ